MPVEECGEVRRRGEVKRRQYVDTGDFAGTKAVTKLRLHSVLIFCRDRFLHDEDLIKLRFDDPG
jgi:hypothetical protein